MINLGLNQYERYFPSGIFTFAISFIQAYFLFSNKAHILQQGNEILKMASFISCSFSGTLLFGDGCFRQQRNLLYRQMRPK